jgi:hypothetical protein
MTSPRSRFPLWLALVAASLLFWTASAGMTVVIDGVRYHYLDDDQMISMRYARNLAEGHGPVWNDGERVEGYTNFGWMLVMAAVHAGGATDAASSLWVRVASWLALCATLGLSWRLLGQLGVRGSPAFAAIVALALAIDLLFWAVNGFETTLLTAVFLWAVCRVLDETSRGAASALTLVLAGLLPVIRADSVDLTAGVVLVVLALGAPKRRALIALAAVPFLVHEAFRVSYYGDWFPNTYYLKVAGRSGLTLAGAGHVKAFLATYAAVAIIAWAGALTRGADRRLVVLAVLPLAGFLRILFTGPDIFAGFRFMAPYLPVLLAVGAASAMVLSAGHAPARRTFAALLLFVTVGGAGVDGRTRLRDLQSPNGLPGINTVTGVLIARHTRPDARIAVMAAGAISYFSRRTSIDILGKTDRYVAHLPPHRLGPTGHNRYDIEYSLRSRPDLVAIFADGAYPERAERAASDPEYEVDREGWGAALVRSPSFVARYRSSPVPLRWLLARNALYVRSDSPELEGLSRWHEPQVSFP